MGEQEFSEDQKCVVLMSILNKRALITARYAEARGYTLPRAPSNLNSSMWNELVKIANAIEGFVVNIITRPGNVPLTLDPDLNLLFGPGLYNQSVVQHLLTVFPKVRFYYMHARWHDGEELIPLNPTTGKPESKELDEDEIYGGVMTGRPRRW